MGTSSLCDVTTTALFDQLDQLDLLLKALAVLNQHYTVVVSQDLTQNQLCVDPDIIGRDDDPVRTVRFTDRDVILARSGLKRSELDLSNIQTHVYKTLLPLPLGLGNSNRGWLSVDAKIRGKIFRFVNTHLETVFPGTETFQEAQADELTEVMDSTQLPVILAGDFNADAKEAGLWPDQTKTPSIILDAGYTDAWHEIYPRKRGFTWPLFQDDPPLGPNPDKPFERIDLIYARDFEVLAINRVGLLARRFASDHAGVVAKLQLDNYWHE